MSEGPISDANLSAKDLHSFFRTVWWKAGMAMEERDACLADTADSFEVRRRIECLLKLFLTALMADRDTTIRPLSMVYRTTGNSRADNCGIYLLNATYERAINKSFYRVWKVMEICYHLLGLGKRATQRELYYKLVSSSSSYISSQEQVNRAIQDAVAVLLCTRRSLGVLASSKGSVVGRLIIEEPDAEMVDCSKLGSSAYPINGDVNLQQRFYSDARYILLIEKDAIFQRLIEERYFDILPCIIITARGYPDLASRVFLYRLHTHFAKLPILALVDWNPAGLAIVCTYKFGSIRMGLEAPRYVCDVKWLGLRHQDAFSYIPTESFESFTKKDVSLASSLLDSKMLQNYEQYRQEVTIMRASRQRAEIEALYVHGYEFLIKFITEKIVQRDYI